MSASLSAQQFNWQGVLRGNDNVPLANQDVGVMITIMQDGSAVMEESHSLQTSDIFLLEITDSAIGTLEIV